MGLITGPQSNSRTLFTVVAILMGVWFFFIQNNLFKSELQKEASFRKAGKVSSIYWSFDDRDMYSGMRHSVELHDDGRVSWDGEPGDAISPSAFRTLAERFLEEDFLNMAELSGMIGPVKENTGTVRATVIYEDKAYAVSFYAGDGGPCVPPRGECVSPIGTCDMIYAMCKLGGAVKNASGYSGDLGI